MAGKFKKGNKFGKGRPKGSKNKATEKVRETFLYFVEANLDRMQEDFDQLEPKERFKILIDVAKFILPTLKAVEFGNILDELSEGEFERLIERLKEDYSMN